MNEAGSKFHQHILVPVAYQHARKAVRAMPVRRSMQLLVFGATLATVSKGVTCTDAAGNQADANFHAACVLAGHGLKALCRLTRAKKGPEIGEHSRAINQLFHRQLYVLGQCREKSAQVTWKVGGRYK